jgi:hypothetical protein
MIKITNEINGKLYELAPAVHGCMGCAFDIKRKDGLGDCKLTKEYSKHAFYQGKIVCSRIYGIWKEVQDVKTKS